jgi:plastocyanin
MQLLTATVKERPRVVETKYGTRVVIDAICQGHEVTIWRGFPDTYAVNLKGGQQVNVTLDSKGKYSLVDNSNFHLDRTNNISL